MAFKMTGKSPIMKALVGKQHNLPPELKAKIEASPIKKRNDPASVTNRVNEGDDKGARIERRRGNAAANGNKGRAARLARKLKAHDNTDNRGKQPTKTKSVSDGGTIEF